MIEGRAVLSIREVALSAEALRALEDVIAAAPLPGAGVWSRLTAPAPFDRKLRVRRAAEARAVLARGVCQEVELRHEAPPALAEHEHGIFLFVPVAERATLLLDIRSTADDARWRLHRAGQLMRARWRWLRFAGLGGCWCFAADGAEIAPRRLGAFRGSALERRRAADVGWPGDDAAIPLALAEIERLAETRRAADTERSRRRTATP